MFSPRAVLSAILLCKIAVVSSQQTYAEISRSAVVQANNDFSSSLYQVLRSEPGSLVVCPLSIQTVMSLVWLGAGGRSAQQLRTGLHLPDNGTVVETGHKSLARELQSSNTVTLDIANKLYIRQGLQVKKEFHKTAVNNFHSDTEEVDFETKTEQVRSSINKWVEDKTHNKIKNMIAEGSLDADTLMIIINAIYFKGGWRYPFEKNNTRTKPFYVSANESVGVSMMHQSEYLSIKESGELDALVLQLPYSDSTLSMIILLPNKIDGLGLLEKGLATMNLRNITRDMWKRDVYVSLPRFKIEKTLKLKETLQELGITDVFSEGVADLSGMTDRRAYVDKVVQKVFVEVTEKGTEAAAATYVQVRPESYSAPKEFIANHPFLFLIQDDSTGTVIFMGRVLQPNQA